MYGKKRGIVGVTPSCEEQDVWKELSQTFSSQYASSQSQPDECAESVSTTTVTVSASPSELLESAGKLGAKRSKHEPADSSLRKFPSESSFSSGGARVEEPVLTVKPRKKRADAQQRGKTPEQMFLDAGQKHIGSIRCSICFMVYYPGQPEDEKTHKKFHSQFDMGIEFKGWQNELLISTEADGSRIILMQKASEKSHRAKLKAILETVNRDLGGVTLSDSGSEAALLAADENLYLLVQSNRIYAVVITRDIQQAFAIDVIKSGSSSSVGGASAREVDAVDANMEVQHPNSFDPSRPVPCFLGIDKIWVHRKKRRQGLARTFVDAIRRSHFLRFGRQLKAEEVAFSQPTQPGRKFATAYTGRSDFLTYK